MRLDSLVTGACTEPPAQGLNWELSHHPPKLEPNPEQVQSDDLETSFGIPRGFVLGQREFVGGRRFGKLDQLGKLSISMGGTRGLEGLLHV